MKDDNPDMLLLAGDLAQFDTTDEDLLLGLLPENQAEAIGKYRRLEDRRRRMLARLLLAFGLQLVEAWSPRRTLSALYVEPEGRPRLRDCRREISFSHSGRWAVCAIGNGSSVGQVGVDVEEIKSLALDEVALVFSEEEMAAIRASADPSVELIRRWTIKEAVLKAQGKGFLGDPRPVKTGSFSGCGEGPGYFWKHIPLDKNYWLTVAAEFSWKSLRQVAPSKKELLAIFDK
ncbi:MAG: 4'-phosphopantetheinyl transferase superfamily protein [Desulfuromonadaceae bacterium]|nr:4'-phosphopantetheinyl transferase superfamily protein [Desulfuromonadaceae bacterium]